MRQRWVGLLSFFALWSADVSAQDPGVFTMVQWFSVTAIGNKRPVIADIELTTEASTPWGIFHQILKGRYWRTSDSKSRQDDTFGNSLLLASSRETWLDHTTRSAVSDTGRGFFFQVPVSWVPGRNPLGKKTVADRAANGWREDILLPNGFLRWDIWTDARLGIPLEIRITGPGTSSIQKLINIEETEPDPELFKVPVEYSTTDCSGARRSTPPPVQCGPGPFSGR